MPLLTSGIGLGMRALLERRIRLLDDGDHWARGARRLQLGQLRRLLATAAETEIGREAGFEQLAALDDAELPRAFREAIPASDYEAWRERLARMRERGEADVCWPGVVRDWAQTSGTTGGEKFIPVSQAMMRSNRKAAFDIFAYAARRDVALARLFGGRMLFLGGSTDVTTNEHGIRTGDLSGLVTRLIRWPLTAVYTPGPDVALMDHWPTKIQRIAEIAVEQDVRFVSGMASWSLLLFERVLELARERGGGERLRDVWPNLELFIHGGVRYPPFDPRVRQVWSGGDEDLPNRLEVYPASEGFIAMQDEPGDAGLRLCADIGIFFEFLPLDRAGEADPPAVLVDEVEPGERYVVVMTTCAGLWRYLIGDVVVFDTIPPDGPPRLRIVGRHRHFINAFGENLIVEEIEDAVVAARDRAGAEIGEFTAAPVYPGEGTNAGLELVVEWADPRASVDAFGAAFDEALQSRNVDYTTKRTASLGMAAPTITTVPPGTFHRWMERRGKLGGQHKVPRCANSREFVDGLRELPSPASI